jgi:hypothetical protein
VIHRRKDAQRAPGPARSREYRAHAVRPFLLGIFLLHLLPHASRPGIIGGDEPHYALMAHSIATEFDIDLREDYRRVEAGSNAAGETCAGEPIHRHLRIVNGREVFGHPLGLPLLISPLVALQHLVVPSASPDLLVGLTTIAVTFVALLAMWRLFIKFLGDMRQASLTVFCGYFASPLWFSSRTFVTEPYTWAFATLAVSSIVASRFALASLFLALTLAMKETALLIVLPILIASAAILGMRRTLSLWVGPAIFAVLFALKNVLLVGTPFSTFHSFGFGNVIDGAAGLLFDPAHGLLWFAPLLVLGVIGWIRRPAVPAIGWIDAAGMAAFVAYFVITAAWIDWRGGSSYAARLLLPALPVLLLPLSRLTSRATPKPILALLCVAYIAGFIVNWCAAIDPFTAFWGISAPALVAKNPWSAILGLIVGSLLLYFLFRETPLTEPQEERR